MKIGEGPQYLTTYVQNGIYVIPNAEAISGEVDIKNSFNDNSLSTIKFYGDMQYDIITDKIAPFMDNISNDTSTIKAQLSEPASIFVEYGNKEGDYTDISFGKADAGNFEGDAVAEGDRQIQTDDFVIPAPFHYRIWAIDKSGNISHSEDQVFEDKTIKNITVTNINNTSATISWETSADSLGKIEYGGSTNYGSASSESAKSKTHSIKLTGLSYNTTYHFRIKAYEEGKEDGAYYSDNQTFSTQTFRISNLRYDRSSSDVPVPVRITWETNAPATCSISGSSSNPDANGTTHEYTMSVAPNVYTLFTVTCTKTGATQTASASGNFTVPLSIDHQSSNPESNGTTLSWTQSLKIPGKIKYYTWWQPSIYYYADYPAVTNQSVTLTDVKPGTVYDWVIIPDPTYIQLSADFAGGNFRTPCPILTNFTSTPIARASDKLVDILMTWDANIKTKGKVTYSAAYGGVGTVYFNENQTQVTMGSFLPGHTYTYTIYTEPYTYTQPYSSPPYTVTGCSAGGVFTAPSISSSGSSAMASPSSVALTPDDSVSRSTSTTSISTNTSTYEKVINKIKTLWGALSDIKIFKLIQGL